MTDFVDLRRKKAAQSSTHTNAGRIPPASEAGRMPPMTSTAKLHPVANAGTVPAAAAEATGAVPTAAPTAPEVTSGAGPRVLNPTNASPAAEVSPADELPAATRAVPKPWVSRYRRAAVLLDLGVALLAAGLGFLVRFGDVEKSFYVLVSVAVAVAWVTTVALAHGYERRFLGVGTDEYRALARSAVGLLSLIAIVSYAAKLELARGYVLVVVPTVLLLDLAARRGLRRWLALQRANGRCLQRTVVIGRADSTATLVRDINRSPVQGLRVVAACVSGLDSTWESSTHLEDVPVFGGPEDALAAVDLFDAEVVAVASHPDLVGHSLRRLAWALEERKVELIVSPGILEVAGPRLSIRPAAGVSLLHVERPVTGGGRILAKNIVDRTLALILALCAMPVLIAIAIGIKLTSPGPIFFSQSRVGAKGEPFNMLKFRTMVPDAEARLAEMATTEGHEVNAVLFKKRDDPRVTGIGKILRRFSLDELPQLVNVLRGEMSLVGPRPPLPREVELYESDAVRRLRVQPGLTGLWQVSGRANLTWDESLRLDLWYVDNWSLLLDLQILARTARAVVRGTGAY